MRRHKVICDLMICLGLEGTAHTFGVGIVNSTGDVLANVNATYQPTKGIEPIEAAKFMISVTDRTLKRAMEVARRELKDIDVVAFSQGPGLPPTLRVTRDFAIGLTKKTKKPLVGVNHCCAHVEIGKLTTGLADPITLYVSGGNSQVLGFAASRYRVFGETLDIAIGNAIDKLARALGLGFPGGPLVEAAAAGGRYVELPYTVKGMDFAFSGLVTAAEKLWRTKKASIADVCFSFQETAFAMLTEVVERALAHTAKTECLLTGGVAANARLQEMLKIMCDERGAKFAVVPREFAGDCGANIAWTGILMFKSKCKPLKDFDIKPRWRTDEVDVVWR